MGQNRRTLNIWVARAMPLLMAGMVGYATWVFLSLVCVHYLLFDRKRKVAAALLFAFYFVFFALLSISYLRTVITLTFNPGYVQQGRNTDDAANLSEKPRVDGAEDGDLETGLRSAQPARITATEGSTEGLARVMTDTSLDTALREGPPQPSPGAPTMTGPPTQILGRPYSQWTYPRPEAQSAPSNLKEFLNKEIFVCESDGLPRYCSKCDCWKPDRAHHCSEVGRCVWRMDHFCPWVGGVVAETSFRYFYQVVVFGTVYCLFLIVTLGVLMHERNKAGMNVDSKWVAALVLACIFALFSAGMTFSTSQLIWSNVSTIDSLSVKTKVYQLAVHDPNPPAPSFASIDSNPYKPSGTRVWLPPNPGPGEEQRCYVIVRTRPGENPWKLNSTYANFKESLGGSWWHWFKFWGVPKPGSSGGEQGFYRWNPEIISRLKKEAGIPVEHTHDKVQG